MKMTILWLIFINILAFGMMGSDKAAAKKGRWRIPEVTLFLTAVIGGAYGALAGMTAFRHKTKKPMFAYGFPAVAIIETMFLMFLLGCSIAS